MERQTDIQNTGQNVKKEESNGKKVTAKERGNNWDAGSIHVNVLYVTYNE